MASDARPPAPGADTSDDGRRGFSVRLLVIAIAAQAVLIGGLVVVAVNGLPFSGSKDGGGGSGVPAQPAARRGEVPKARVNRFDGRAALAIAKQQVDAGQRPAGSATLRREAVKLRGMLPGGRFENLPGMPGLRNIVGELPGPGPVIVIGAHYDTEYHPKGFVGANDAAAAVGAVIELSNALAKLPRTAVAPGVRFVLFDGEEEPHPTDDFYADALRGSKSYVQNHAEEVRAMVLLDYIGAKGVRLPREGTSTEPLWAQVRGAAARVGVGAMFPNRTQESIFDDHTPFLRAGIPAVDLIDWSYRYKDGLQDTFDKLSADSIDAVGETIVELIRTWPTS
jgi:hypothetical protein